MEMIHTNTTFNTEPVYVRSISLSRCLMAAVVYQLIQMGTQPGQDRRAGDPRHGAPQQLCA